MRLSIGLVALLVVACRTHTVDDCRPACDAADVEAFAGCVARGSEACEPGNRRCCALEADCLGMLDDQTVVTSQPSCDVVTEDQCWPPCSSEDEAFFDDCVTGSTGLCAGGDDVCCALAADCLGTLGDLVVTADGCCSGPDECAAGQVCDPMFWTCTDVSPLCGDGATTGTEACDDGNNVTETCDYGMTSCDVCAADCTLQPGATSYCGDDLIDETHGEACEPPGTSTCDPNCNAYPAHCSDGVQTRGTDETDVDCGGSCWGCAPSEGCGTEADCRVVTPECFATVSCDASKSMCWETPDCDDGDPCTENLCEAGVGCDFTTPVDVDRDGFFPLDLGCGNDCDDFRDWVNPGVLFDLGCSTTELGFGVDDDCDGFTDEDC